MIATPTVIVLTMTIGAVRVATYKNARLASVRLVTKIISMCMTSMTKATDVACGMVI